jgi:hypothetical protein
MNICLTRWMKNVLVVGVMAIAAGDAYAAGSDYRNDQPVGGTSAWPEGVKELVNTTNRVHGFFVNAEDVFFFAGSATNFAAFLNDYSKIQGVEKHQLVLHEGAGEAKSPWSETSRPCDWKLRAGPKSWLTRNANDKAFVLEVHFWMGGKMALDQVTVPKNIEFAGDYFKNFESITNGMTRAAVGKRLTMDGGLQGASPVRFIDPACPCFKINVEFDFKRDAADQNRAIMGKDDKVLRVSKPYLESPFSD